MKEYIFMPEWQKALKQAHKIIIGGPVKDFQELIRQLEKMERVAKKYPRQHQLINLV